MLTEFRRNLRIGTKTGLMFDLKTRFELEFLSQQHHPISHFRHFLSSSYLTRRTTLVLTHIQIGDPVSSSKNNITILLVLIVSS